MPGNESAAWVKGGAINRNQNPADRISAFSTLPSAPDIEAGWATIAWHAAAMEAVELLARSGEVFSIDDVVELAGPPIHPHQASTVFGVASRLGLITKIGGKVGERGRLVRIWRGAAA